MPVEKIFLVQLADYFFEYSDRQADMIELARHQRLFPGEGLHDVRDLVQLLEDKGYRGHYTFEVFNDDYVNSDPMVIGQRAMKSARWISESRVGTSDSSRPIGLNPIRNIHDFRQDHPHRPPRLSRPRASRLP